MNVTTFEIQSVHGLKETFVVSPNGTVDTTQSYTDRSKQPNGRTSESDEQDRNSRK